jgi:acyl-CoA thioesterase
MDEAVREAIVRRMSDEPFAQKFGIRLVAIEAGYSKVRMQITADMENLLGMAHGGAIFALADAAFETASNSHGTVAVALNMSITYLAACSPGAVLFAEAREVNLTRKTACYDIRVHDEDEKLIALCQATVYRKGTPLPYVGV